MRYVWMLLVLLLALAACAPADAPQASATPASVAGTPLPTLDPNVTPSPTDDPFTVRVTREVNLTPDILDGVTMGGTELDFASATEDVNLGQPYALIEFLQYDGANRTEPLNISINADGSYTRNGVAGMLAQDQLQALWAAFDETRFFSIQNVMVSLAPSEGMKYSVRAVRGENDRRIDSQDGMMPPEYKALLARLLLIGVQ